jgi:phytoene dehydrogenase-like protein
MKVVIIGSGISGLTAALYMLQDGHQVVVLEQYETPGGVTAAIRRDGYAWEQGQMLVEGFGPGEVVGTILSELGIFDQIETVRDDRAYRFPDFEICRPDQYAGPSWRIDHLKEIFPAERRNLDRYYRFYGRIMKLRALAFSAERSRGLSAILSKLRLYAALLPLWSKRNWSAARMADHLFDDDRLKAVFLALLADFVVRPSQFQGLGIPAINPESAFERRLDLTGRGIPQPSYRNIVGGCDALVSVMVREIAARGGRISCGTEVTRIRIEQNRATGVELADGTVEPADLVVASGGAREVFFGLVGRSSLPDDFVQKIDDIPLMESVFMVHLGVDFDPLKYQKNPVCYYYLTYDIEKGVEEVQSGRYSEGDDGFLIYIPSVNSPEMAPEGHHAVTVYTIAPDTLEEGSWAEKKEEYADKLLDHAERVMPGLKKAADPRIIVTPDDFKNRVRLNHHSFGGAAPVMGRPGAPYQTPVNGLWFVGAQSRSGAGLNNVMHGVWQATAEIRKSISS